MAVTAPDCIHLFVFLLMMFLCYLWYEVSRKIKPGAHSCSRQSCSQASLTGKITCCCHAVDRTGIIESTLLGSEHEPDANRRGCTARMAAAHQPQPLALGPLTATLNRSTGDYDITASCTIRASQSAPNTAVLSELVPGITVAPTNARAEHLSESEHDSHKATIGSSRSSLRSASPVDTTLIAAGRHPDVLLGATTGLALTDDDGLWFDRLLERTMIEPSLATGDGAYALERWLMRADGPFVPWPSFEGTIWTRREQDS